MWTEQCQVSFDPLKGKLTMAPVLAYAYFSLPLILEVNASKSIGLRCGQWPMLATMQEHTVYMLRVLSITLS